MSFYQSICEQLRHTPKTWLVTGAAGFIGCNILEQLLTLDQKVVALDDFSTGHRKNLQQVEACVTQEQWQRCTFHEIDIRNLEHCQNICTDIDIVLHQAALGSIPRSLTNPITTNQVNIDGFLNMLVAARDQGVQRFVYAASSSTYGDHPALPKVEECIGSPLSPYAITKYVNELYAQVFAHAYGMETIGLRYFNIFGRRQNPYGAYAAVIPKWITHILTGKTVIIHGDGETSRDFCYIDNCIQANLLAALTDNPQAVNQVYNIAVQQRTTLNQLFNSIMQGLQKQIPSLIEVELIYGDFMPGDVRHSLANISKAKKLLGYTPTHTFSQGIEEAMAWYVANLSQ